MEALHITQEVNYPRVEGYLRQIQSNPITDVLVPHQINGAAIGGESALIQFLITWAKLNPNGQTIIARKGDDTKEHQVKHLSKLAYGFVAMLMGKNVILEDEDETCSQLAYANCQQIVLNLEAPLDEAINDAYYGHRTFLPCVDHSTRPNSPVFYHSTGDVRRRVEFSHIARQLLNQRSEKLVDKLPDNVVRGLGAIIYELFLNTHDWARTDLNKRRLKKSIRGLFLTRRDIPASGISKAAGNNIGTATYMQTLKDHDENHKARFIELSIFDSGPGLAARWASMQKNPRKIDSSVTLREEFDLCMACLGKCRTTSHHSYRGLGLYDVMRTLNTLRAMVRIRTGHLSMVRDFIESPLEEKEVIGPKLFYGTEHQDDESRLAYASGTLFTILFPV